MADNGEVEIAGEEVSQPTIYELSESPTPADDAINKFMAENGFLNQVAANDLVVTDGISEVANAQVAKVATAQIAEVAKAQVADKARVDEAWPMRGRGADNGSDDEEEADDLAADPTPPRPAPPHPDDDAVADGEDEVVVLHKETAASKLGLGLCVFSGDVAHPRVQLVKPGSLASASGRLQVMDIITAINGTPIATDKQALDLISSAQGDVRFAVRRDGCRPEQFLVRKTSRVFRKPSDSRPAASSPQLDAEPPLANAAPAAVSATHVPSKVRRRPSLDEMFFQTAATPESVVNMLLRAAAAAPAAEPVDAPATAGCGAPMNAVWANQMDFVASMLESNQSPSAAAAPAEAIADSLPKPKLVKKGSIDDRMKAQAAARQAEAATPERVKKGSVDDRMKAQAAARQAEAAFTEPQPKQAEAGRVQTTPGGRPSREFRRPSQLLPANAPSAGKEPGKAHAGAKEAAAEAMLAEAETAATAMQKLVRGRSSRIVSTEKMQAGKMQTTPFRVFRRRSSELLPDNIPSAEKAPGNKGRARGSMIEEINAMIDEDRTNKSRAPRRSRHNSPHRGSRVGLWAAGRLANGG